VLRVGFGFLLDPTLNTSLELDLQEGMPCRLPCHTWDLGLGTYDRDPMWGGKSQLPCSQRLRLHRLTSSGLRFRTLCPMCNGPKELNTWPKNGLPTCNNLIHVNLIHVTTKASQLIGYWTQEKHMLYFTQCNKYTTYVLPYGKNICLTIKLNCFVRSLNFIIAAHVLQRPPGLRKPRPYVESWDTCYLIDRRYPPIPTNSILPM
jgi:hypothetical protein